jgi:ATP-dependent protease ClpP protease subunit
MKEVFFRLNKTINEKVSNEFDLFLKKVDLQVEYVHIMFDTNGGELGYAFNIVNNISKSSFKFIGIAYEKVHSAAIPIFLSTHVRFGYENASARIHRAIPKDGVELENIKVKETEDQVFKLIAEKLNISVEEVEKLANANNGEGTIISMDHSLGKKFFFGS